MNSKPATKVSQSAESTQEVDPTRRLSLASRPASHQKYTPYPKQFHPELLDRRWPNRRIDFAPRWCSVDLRDGNQALVNPMNAAKKIEMFNLLVEVGFKEIEIGFPSASQTEFDFTRHLIEKNLIPEDVYPQVLTQARAHLIERSFEALKGAKQAIMHLYNSTSELQRRVVFKLGQDEILQIAVDGAKLIKKLADSSSTDFVLEYSPESFTGTEPEFSLKVCEAVIDIWNPTPDRKIIINLPSTVEMTTPNVYADQIEWFSRNVKNRESIILSLHTHNDRGTGVAATELALLAGAERVEGTLFGNGERTGNVDVVTVALNMYSQGIDPKLSLKDMQRIRKVFERCTELKIHERHPYAGELVFTAFSGSHQDAINKGMKELTASESNSWEVPYLPIDPRDLGRTYEAIIRINSQSGKGGVAYIMQSEFGCDLPKDMHPEVSAVVQKISEESGAEVPPKVIWDAFSEEFINKNTPYNFVNFRSWQNETRSVRVNCALTVEINGEARELVGEGNGPIDACRDALIRSGCPHFTLRKFVEHARSAGSDAEAVAYIYIQVELDGKNAPETHKRYGVGIHSSMEKASVKALLSAVNRAVGSSL